MSWTDFILIYRLSLISFSSFIFISFEIKVAIWAIHLICRLAHSNLASEIKWNFSRQQMKAVPNGIEMDNFRPGCPVANELRWTGNPMLAASAAFGLPGRTDLWDEMHTISDECKRKVHLLFVFQNVPNFTTRALNAKNRSNRQAGRMGKYTNERNDVFSYIFRVWENENDEVQKHIYF